jgi:hypothetical protein
MNVNKKIYTEFIGLRVTKEEKDLFLKRLCRRKEDKLSVKLREYILSKLSEEPVYEYSIRQNRNNKMEVTIWENGQERDYLIYDSIEQAMKYVRSIAAIKRK